MLTKTIQNVNPYIPTYSIFCIIIVYSVRELDRETQGKARLPKDLKSSTDGQINDIETKLNPLLFSLHQNYMK